MLPLPPCPFFAGSAPSPLQDFRRTLPLTFPQLNTILPARPPFPTRNFSKEIDEEGKNRNLANGDQFADLPTPDIGKSGNL